MEIKTIEIAGFNSALKALRLPYGLKTRSVTDNDVRISDKADRTWEQENKFRDSGVKEWKPIHSIITSSTTIIDPKDLALLQTLIKRGDEHAKVVRGIIAYAEITAPIYFWSEIETHAAGHQRLCSKSTMHIDCKHLKGEELQKAKADIPMGKELTKIDFFSYQCLRNIYRQRKNHRLPEWHIFIDWVKTLPLAQELILIDKQ